MLAVPIVLALTLASDPLSALEAKADGLKSAGREKTYAIRREIGEGVRKLVSQDKLKSGEDFRRAAKVWPALDNEFEDARIRYELVLVAVALDDRPARDLIRPNWDSLMAAQGRPQRFGTVLEAPDLPRQPFDPVPKGVEAAYRGVPSTSTADDKEVQAIVDADQAARQGDFTKMTVKQIEEMVEGDRKRLARIKEIVTGPTLQTANDFFNAALTMQHGSTVLDIVMAHELAVSSVLRGDTKSARWLAAASYDRMLRYGGHRQRFATQYDMEGLQRVDTDGINDRMRQAMKCPTLAQAKKRVLR